jgi:NADH:ubiquinone oxidoreductase subunit C
MTGTVTPEIIAEGMKQFGTAGQTLKNRLIIPVAPDRLHDAVRTARALLLFDRLLTISTADNGETFELLYHLIGPHRIVLSLSLSLPRDKPSVPTVSDLLPPAAIYERQIHDLFGIMFDGHPGLSRLMLNEDWPENQYPLRKDWKPDPARFYGGIQEGRT